MMLRYLIAAVTIALGAAAVHAQDTVPAQTRWAQVAACAAERCNESRHACVDAVLRAAGALDAATEVAVNRENFGRTDRPAPTPPPPPPPPVAAPASAARPAPAAPPPLAAPPAPIDGITTQVASARLGSDRRLMVVTAEGAVWRQTDTDVIRRLPRAGESFEVRNGALGSFRCTFNGNTSFRCERRD
jgi:hypothetical protein